MRGFFAKPYRFAAIFSVLLVLCTAFVFLNAFVLPAAMQTVSTASASAKGTQAETATDAVLTDTSYTDENIQITIQTVRTNDTTVYIANVVLTSVEYLKTALANDTFGRNITATTSEIAQAHSAILAINGDYYGFRNYGLVLRNGVLYRAASAKSPSGQALIIDDAGAFAIEDESSLDGDWQTDAGIWQGFSFGPVLVNDGQIQVTATAEVSQSMNSNPRTAIGMITPLHYLFVVSDGRTAQSAGLSLLELAEVLQGYGCTVAYNLDGGGSTTMYFAGKVVNQPTTNGKTISQRKVSDIVYIGY